MLADVEQAALDRQWMSCAATSVTSPRADGRVQRRIGGRPGARGRRYLRQSACSVQQRRHGGRPGAIWESTLNDWEWILGVNVWGVIHGLRAFSPRMLEHGEAGWIVNTASMGGLVPGNSASGISKHAVVAISEALYSQLKVRDSAIGCSVLCPIFVKTNLVRATRNRPHQLEDRDLPPTAGMPRSRFSGRMENGQPPSEIAVRMSVCAMDLPVTAESVLAALDSA